jgi:hypothetical protein
MRELKRVYHIGDTIMSENMVLNMVADGGTKFVITHVYTKEDGNREYNICNLVTIKESEISGLVKPGKPLPQYSKVYVDTRNSSIEDDYHEGNILRTWENNYGDVMYEVFLDDLGRSAWFYCNDVYTVLGDK